MKPIYFCCFAFALLLSLYTAAFSQQDSVSFSWPQGKSFALSLSFDDARSSQVEVGTALLNRYQAKATFYVVPASVEQQLESWQQAVKDGHEIGNHSLQHPCTGNFAWSRHKALENYTMQEMYNELHEASSQIEAMLGIRPASFAYPCGQTFLGRGLDTRSYVPLVAGMFQTGRGWLGEASNDPEFCDMAQLLCIEMDNKTFPEILALIEQARENSSWIILGGHEMGEGGPQTSSLAMLEQLLQYAGDPEHGVWMATVGEVAQYIQKNRKVSSR